MNIFNLRQALIPSFTAQEFELCEEKTEETYLNLSFIKKDFLIEIYFDSEDSSLEFSLDRPSFGFSESHFLSSDSDHFTFTNDFIAKVNKLISDDFHLVNLTKNDCELFLKTGSYDGLSSGLIEYKDSLYYIQTITNPYHKHRCLEDRNKKVWRHFYVYELFKEELDKIVINSLDFMRHINLSSLCKEWSSLNLDTGDEADHQTHFRGKYRYSFEPKNNPVMKLTLFY